ncbi:MAG: hypothetical protein ACLFM0_01920 [Spirochaetales bacterium]
MRTKTTAAVVLLALLAPAAAVAGESAIDINLRAETGILGVAHHTLRFGEEEAGNDLFDYRRQGGQEILFPYSRFTVEAALADRHELEFLYQPLTLESRTRVPEDETLTVDGVTFGEEGGGDQAPIDLVYGFDFWRTTYRYRFYDDSRFRVSAGGSAQLRNASILFESADGEKRVISQDLGPVALLSVHSRYEPASRFFAEATLEGFYAPIRYLNLGDVDVLGWIYDVAVRAGVEANADSEAFIGVRALGGGADGSGSEKSVWTVTDDRQTYNNLNTYAVSLGVRVGL